MGVGAIAELLHPLQVGVIGIGAGDAPWLEVGEEHGAAAAEAHPTGLTVQLAVALAVEGHAQRVGVLHLLRWCVEPWGAAEQGDLSSPAALQARQDGLTGMGPFGQFLSHHLGGIFTSEQPLAQGAVFQGAKAEVVGEGDDGSDLLGLPALGHRQQLHYAGPVELLHFSKQQAVGFLLADRGTHPHRAVLQPRGAIPNSGYSSRAAVSLQAAALEFLDDRQSRRQPSGR